MNIFSTYFLHLLFHSNSMKQSCYHMKLQISFMIMLFIHTLCFSNVFWFRKLEVNLTTFLLFFVLCRIITCIDWKLTSSKVENISCYNRKLTYLLFFLFDFYLLRYFSFLYDLVIYQNTFKAKLWQLSCIKI